MLLSILLNTTISAAINSAIDKYYWISTIIVTTVNDTLTTTTIATADVAIRTINININTKPSIPLTIKALLILILYSTAVDNTMLP